MADVKKSATVGDYVININDDNSVTVLKGDIVCSNTTAALREVAVLAGFIPDEKWNTRQFGSKLVDAINGGVPAPAPQETVPVELSLIHI